MKHIILFDGVCNLCNSAVQFVIKRDPDGQFSFASLQGEKGQKLLEQHNIQPETDSVILIESNGKVYEKSAAALRISMRLKGGWKLAQILLVVPPFIRNVFYRIIARNRYKWFGRQTECMMPTQEQKNRFLD